MNSVTLMNSGTLMNSAHDFRDPHDFRSSLPETNEFAVRTELRNVENGFRFKTWYRCFAQEFGI